MSRLAKKTIKLLEGVTVVEDGGFLSVRGAMGENKLKLAPGVRVSVNNGSVRVETESSRKKEAAGLGTSWSLIRNAIKGVKDGFSKILEVEGVGYRPLLEGKDVVLHLGYAVPVRVRIPEGVRVEIDKGTIKISGINKESVGQTAADIRAMKKPEPYKGKGIRYRGEIVRRKAGKKAGAAAT